MRTVQRWDKKGGVPIHHAPTGERSHPYASTDDLDRWMAQRDGRPPADGMAGDPPGDPPAVDADTTRPRGRLSRAALVAVGILALTAIGLVIAAWRAPGEPVAVRVEGTRLTVLDARGRTNWSKDIPELADRDLSTLPVKPDDWTVADVNGDGRQEVLVNVPASRHGDTTGRLVTFDHRGRQIWEFRYGRPREWEGRRFSAKYGGRVIRAFSARGRRYVLTLASHSLWFPSQVALLDAESGALVDEYWHPGAVHFALAHDMDGDQEPEVLLAGINNPGPGLGHGVLAALSVPFARTPAKEGGLSAFSGGRELTYLVFPRPDVCSAEGHYPFVTKLSSEPDGQILFRISCGDSTFHHTLDRALTPVDARFSDNTFAHHDRLEHQGLLDHALDAEEGACLQQVARYPTAVDGNGSSLASRWRRCE